MLKVPDASPNQLGFVGMFLPTGEEQLGAAPTSIDSGLYNPMLVLQAYRGNLGLDHGTPQNVYVLDTQKLEAINSMAQGNGLILDAARNSLPLADGAGTIEFLGVKRYVGLEVRSDPGRPLALASFIILFVGLIISLFVARRRVWVRAYQDQQDGQPVLVVEYALLARGEDPRLAQEADLLTDLFADRWNLDLGEA